MAKTLEQQLNAAGWDDIAILNLDGKDVLVLMCQTKQGSLTLRQLLGENPYNLRVYADESTGICTLEFELIDAGIGFKIETGRNAITYPPMKKLLEGQVKLMTTGVWTEGNKSNRKFEYNAGFLRLGALNLGEALSQATEVQFVPGQLANEPSVIVLIFRDYDHILGAEADEAYNQLMDQMVGNPTLEIAPHDGIVDLRIWDILLDLDVAIMGLKYNPVQLEEFLKATEPNHSFAFVLGFLPTRGERATIASTKHEGYEMITLKGYVVKK